MKKEIGTQLNLIGARPADTRDILKKYIVNPRHEATIALIEAVALSTCTLPEKVLIYSKIQDLIFTMIDEKQANSRVIN